MRNRIGFKHYEDEDWEDDYWEDNSPEHFDTIQHFQVEDEYDQEVYEETSSRRIFGLDLTIGNYTITFFEIIRY